MPLQFGRFSLDSREYRLLRDGQPLSISPKPFDLLVALATRPSQLVTREELLREVWKDTVVEQSSLNAAMSVLRQALGEDAASIIETVPGRGYRFIAPVTHAPPVAPVASASAREGSGELRRDRAEPASGREGGPATRVVIVDDHAVVRMGVRALVERTPGFVIVGEAGSIEDAGPIMQSAQPDLLILDMMLGDISSLSSIKAWRASAPGLRVIMLSMHDEDGHARAALAAGAHGYVMKAGMTGELTAAMGAVSGGDVWVSEKLSRAILKEFADRASR
jgi:DNA-binding response OmpR family regulator